METGVRGTDTKELWRQYKRQGDQKARERLVLAYAPLVKYVSGRIASGLPSHIEESDLISYGMVGLVRAIERYDITRDVKFETYAIARVKGSIIDELRSLDWVPRSIRSKMRNIERANSDLEGELGRAPTDEEVSKRLDISVEDFQQTLTDISSSSMVALDELWTVSDSSGDKITLLDTIKDESADDPLKEIDYGELKDRLAQAVSELPDREKLVTALYYYENLTLREISEVIDVTESRVSQLHTRAVLRLKGKLQQAEE